MPSPLDEQASRHGPPGHRSRWSALHAAPGAAETSRRWSDWNPSLPATDLFLADADRLDVLGRLGATAREFELELLAYVLLGNHYHTLLAIPDARLSLALQHLHTEYSRQHNRRYGRSAHLFRAHPFARPIENDGDPLGTYRYLARNPVEAKLASDPLGWPWNGARAHVGLEQARVPVAEASLRAAPWAGAQTGASTIAP